MQFAFSGSLCRDDGRNGERGVMTYHRMLQSRSIWVHNAPSHFLGIICHFWSHVGKEACSRWIFHQLLPGSGFLCMLSSGTPAPRHAHSLAWVHSPGLRVSGNKRCTLRNTLASSTAVFYLSYINNEGIYGVGEEELIHWELVNLCSLHPFIQTTAFGVNNGATDMRLCIDPLLRKVHW